MQRTTTSEALIEYFKKRGFKLTEADKEHIRYVISEVMKDSYNSGVAETEQFQNENREIDCGCGQVNCPICGG
jgi:hypothetical protein